MSKTETLTDRLRTTDKCEYIHLGCKNGAGWLFIGTCEDLRDRLYELDLKWLDNLYKAIQEHDRIIAGAGKTLEFSENYIAENMAHLTEFDKAVPQRAKLDDYLSGLKNYYRKALNSKKKIARHQKLKDQALADLCEWKPFSRRKVIETYHHYEAPAGTAILVEGTTNGDYWFIEEQLREEEKEKEKEGKKDDKGRLCVSEG